MNTQLNVLIFPCNSENAIEIIRSLRDSIGVSIYGISHDKCYAEKLIDNLEMDFPNIKDNDFLVKFNKYLSLNNIDYIFPTHDDVVLYLTKNKKSLSSDVISSEYSTAQLCRDKLLFYKSIKNKSYCPEVYQEISDNLPEVVFVKPREGQGAKGAYKIHKQKLSNIDMSKMLCMEYLHGDECTIDCLSDKSGKLLYHGARLRNKTFGGISTSSTFIESKKISLIAKDLSEHITFNGPWFFQVKKDDLGQFKVMEISSRVSGSMNMYRPRGINFSLLSLNIWCDNNIIINDLKIDYRCERALDNAYITDIKYDKVFIDFDDTIIQDGKVNIRIISFLYQCQNNNIQINLLTRHSHDIYKTLSLYKISTSLFNRIIHINNETIKSSYITDNSIFIDNSFDERYAVFKTRKCPVFDLDAIELLASKY